MGLCISNMPNYFTDTGINVCFSTEIFPIYNTPYFFGGIGSARNANSVIKLFNIIYLGLAALIFLYWLYLKFIGI